LEHEIDCYGNGSKCIAIESQCDGVADCPNGKDESVDLCGKPDEGIFAYFVDSLAYDTFLLLNRVHVLSFV